MANLYLGIVFFLIGLAYWFVTFGPWELGVVSILVAFVLGFFGFLLPKPKLSTLEEMNKKLQELALMQGIYITRLYRSRSPSEIANIEKDLRSVSLGIEEIQKKISTYNFERSEDESIN